MKEVVKINSFGLINYANRLMSKLYEDISTDIVLENTYESCEKYHMMTIEKLDNLLSVCSMYSSSKWRTYAYGRISYILQLEKGFHFDQLYSNSHLRFDIRMYLINVTEKMVSEFDNLIEYLTFQALEDPKAMEFCTEIRRFLGEILIYTVTCKPGDMWNEFKFSIEPYESDNNTDDEKLLNKVFKVYKDAYLINYGEKTYVIKPGVVSVWKRND